MSLAGTRVFVVEDEALILMTLEDLLVDLGCEVAATAMTVEDALLRAAGLAFDVAILDINIAGKPVDPVAACVAARGIPCILASGYERTMAAPAGHPGRPPVLLPKPYTLGQLRAALTAVLLRAATGAEVP